MLAEIPVRDYQCPPCTSEEPQRTILDRSSTEFRDVKNFFQNALSGAGMEVDRIEVLMNPNTKPYAKNVKKFKKAKPDSVVKRLLHGTGEDNVDSIVEDNLLLHHVTQPSNLYRK